MATRGLFRGRGGYGRGGRGPHAGGPQGGGHRGPTQAGHGPQGVRVGNVRQVPPTSFCLDDIGKMLQQLTTTVTGLSNRVESLEKGRRPDKVSGRPTTAATTSAGPPPPTTQTMSHNQDFADVCKCLYRWVQLQHHEENWKTLPKSLNERIQKLVADINPPMVDDDFRKRLAAATKDYTGKMVQLVQEHIKKHRIDKEIHAGVLSRQDIDRATEVASKYLSTRLGKRLDANKRTALLKEAADFVGRMRRPPPSRPTVPPQASVVAPAVTSQASSPPLVHMDTEWHLVGHKRKAGGSPVSTSSTPPTSNRFQALAATNDDDDEDEDEEVELQQSRPTVYPRVLHSTKKSRPTPTARRTSPARSPSPTASTSTASTSSPPACSRVRQYRGDKDQWSIQPAEETKFLVIGDSNLRHAADFPAEWEVHFMSGAHFRHVTQAVKSIPQEPQGKYTVFVQAGINHRDRYDTTVEKDIRDLVLALSMNTGIRRSLHVGVSTSLSLCSDFRNNVRKINDYFKHCLQEENCIQPLQPNDVDITRTDTTWGIHHTPATTEKIFGPIFQLDF